MLPSSKSLIRRVALCAAVCLPLVVSACGGSSSSGTAANVWSFDGGSTTVNALGSYGTAGTAGGQPGARAQAASWHDASGRLWMFGGNGYAASGGAGELADLWRYDTATSQWTWVAGPSTTGTSGVYGTQGSSASTNWPGARDSAQTWTDAAGNFWMYGGHGVDASGTSGMLGDLWEYSAGAWTWVGGSNSAGTATSATAPGARSAAATWIDSSGNLWMFGGNGFDSNDKQGPLGDLWEYSGGKWALVGGSTLASAAGNWGLQGQAASTNVPSARYGAASWVDSSGHFWLFGGYGIDSSGKLGQLGDLWEFDPTTKSWTWVSGSALAQAIGVYGTSSVSLSGNTPGARAYATAWSDANGNLWMFGGYGVDAYGVVAPLNDLWEYSTSTGLWTWVSGSNAVNAKGSYAGSGSNSANAAGARYGATGWIDSSGRLWFFGGAGLDATPTLGDLNDLWSYTP